jgi:hypothetical protein
MGANPTIYCLENLTDYSEFERLCTDLMALEGYPSIEPLGGFSDKGRDAVHIDRSGKTTIFAYSVRENWRVKLAEDAAKVFRHGHICDTLVFITTSKFSATERDEAVGALHREYGWMLEIYGVERLRVLLEVSHPQIINNHPQIFNPKLYLLQQETNERKHIFLSYVQNDWGLAEWLTRKLTTEGYLVWCERYNLFGGESYPDSIDDAANNLAFCMIALYSKASLNNQEVMRHRHLALSIGKQRSSEFLLPLNVDRINVRRLDRETSSLVFIPFYDSWGEGLAQLLKKLETMKCPKTSLDGNRIAATEYLGDDVLSEKPENLYSNYLMIDKLPRYIYVFKAGRPIPFEDRSEVELKWAYKKVGSRLYLGFHRPPVEIEQRYDISDIDSREWFGEATIHNVSTNNLVSELVRKSLVVKCQQKGLQYCTATNLQYFPSGLVDNNNLKIMRPDGSKTHVISNGQRTYPTFKGGEIYLYALAPVFHVVQDVFEKPVVQAEIRVRLSDTEGRPLDRRKRNSRRKHLCKGWWNYEWLHRLLAVCQYLADDGKIVIGDSEEEHIVIDASPFCLTSTTSIDEDSLNRMRERKQKVIAELGLSSDSDEVEIDGEINYE